MRGYDKHSNAFKRYKDNVTNEEKGDGQIKKKLLETFKFVFEDSLHRRILDVSNRSCCLFVKDEP